MSNHKGSNVQQKDSGHKADSVAIDVYLAEYADIQQNIKDRVQLEQTIFNYTIVLLAALIPATAQIIDKKAYAVLFIAPCVFCTIAILALRQDVVISCLAQYAYQNVYPRLRLAADDGTILTFEDRLFKMRNQLRYYPIAVAHYAVFFTPSIGSLIGIVYLKASHNYRWLTIDTVLLIADLCFIAATIALVFFLSRKAYGEITKK